jgi:hypothetical protein
MLLVAMLSKISQTKVHSRFNGENVDYALPFRQIELVVINNFDFFYEQFEILARFFFMFKNLCMAFVHL